MTLALCTWTILIIITLFLKETIIVALIVQVLSIKDVVQRSLVRSLNIYINHTSNIFSFNRSKISLFYFYFIILILILF